MERMKKPVSEFGGFRVGDSVRLKIKGVAEDHTAKIHHIKKTGEFFVDLKSKSCPDGKGIWGPLWVNELEKVTA